MDVKDLGRRVLKDALTPISLQQAQRKRPVNSPKTQEATPEPSNSVGKMPVKVEADLRRGLNEAINSINIAADATGSLSNYLSSIDGFIEQAQRPDNTPQRQKALESEANQLVDEIKRTAKELSRVAPPNITNDEVRREIEERIGRSLDALLPEDAADSLGIGPVSFSRKESIIETITNVTAARQRVEELRKSVQESGSSLKMAVLSFEIAEQNGEAARASIRDVEEAAKLVDEMEANIFRNPDDALGSIGTNLVVRSLDLLK